ncbi:anaerobic carbon-monoxide dehydrogenase catalytic subunit [Desulfuromonas sp. CSMB_57]|uniref:anaerobic carbon-monoxide dehydrogenase catalytic subunit n=1 Tax=Desulfuromonas sp. CSMB_57 TaxID=2807629 RepID=UPI001CD3D72B|nr:anaerobic carbon-monoxide dehydrogenase catalytic subunit [Desulfuromonas sp. CSMB_57]
MPHCKSADTCLSHYLESRTDINTAFDRFAEQQVKCGFAQLGVCCRLCSNGPCRITPDSPKGVCGATADGIVARNFLRMVTAGAGCYLHVCEATARRLKAIGEGISPVPIRSKQSLDQLAAMLGIEANTTEEKARLVADGVLADLYKPRHEKMELVQFLVPQERLDTWNRLGIFPGGAKAEVFDALVKTSTNLNTDPIDQLLHCLNLGISTGLYGLTMTNLMNDVIMGEPEIRIAATGFSVADPDYVNIAVSGHSHSVFAGLIAYLETAAGQDVGRAAGAKGVRIVGMTCVGQDMQLRAGASGTEIFSGQAGNNFTQEALLATGAVDMVISEFNCTLSGIEPIAEAKQIKLVCLDDVAKLTSSELLADIPGQERELAQKLTRMAADQYRQRRAPGSEKIRIDLPRHGHQDVVTGVSEKSLVQFLGGSLQPLVDLVAGGRIKGVAAVLGCSNLAEGGHDVMTVNLTRELIQRDILVLSAGCTTGGLANCGFCSPSAKDWAGPGLKGVCEALGIPPVLNFGPCLSIGRIEMVAKALAETMGVSLPQLPVVISAPQWLEEQALADGCFGLALGLTLHLAQAPPVTGSPLITKVLTEDLPNLTGGRLFIEADPVKTAELMEGIIRDKLQALGVAA